MKHIAKLTILAAFAAITVTSSFASGANWPSPPRSDVAPRVIASPVATMKCDTMSVASGPKSGGTQIVSCKSYASVRPADCRIACMSK